MTKHEFFARDNRCYFFDDPAAIRDYCLTYWPEDCEHIIRVADQVLRDYYLFDLKWDMERTWEPVIFTNGIKWDYMPGDDPEFIFQFNRHRFFICLGQAYHLTGKEVYAEKFVSLLTDWITRVKRTEETEKSTWRILEAGIRGENWTKAIRYFKDSPYLTDQAVDLFYNSLREHGEFIIQMHSPYRYISNWGVLENHGLFEIAMAMPDEGLRNRYAAIALDHLEIEATMQIMGDGVQWEQSPMYHNEVLHCFEDVCILALRNQIPLPPSIPKAVGKMAYADVAWKKPDHHQFLMGDSDDTDIRDLISVGAWLFRDPVLKFAGFSRLDFESVWDLGIEAAREYEQLESKRPDFTSIALCDSGNYYLRSGWEEDGNLLHFHCGTLGAGHGHSDKLHVDLVIQGEDVLTDGGRYRYVAGADRFEFKDPCCHNTITIDDQYFTVCKDSWECSKLSQPVKQQFVETKHYEFVQGGHLGYLDMGEGVFVNRKIIHIKPDFYILADELYSGGSHSFQQYFHFSEGGNVTLSEKEKRAVYRGERAEAVFHFLRDGINLTRYPSRISRHYNQAVMRESIKAEGNQKGFASLITVIQGGKKGELVPAKVEYIPVKSALKGTFYPSSMAEAVKIQVEGEEYVAVICHQEVNSPTDLVEAEGCLGFGNVILFRKSEGVVGGTVLCY